MLLAFAGENPEEVILVAGAIADIVAVAVAEGPKTQSELSLALLEESRCLRASMAVANTRAAVSVSGSFSN